MSKSLSLAELTNLYSQQKKPPTPLLESSFMPGKDVLEKLNKLFYARQ